MQNYRDLLNEELNERQRRNRGYSQRAFARDLGLSPGHYSEIIKNKKKLSSDKASEVIAKLKWPSQKKNLFLNLVRYDLASSEEHLKVISSEINKTRRPKSYQLLQHQTFQMIANWHYHALLALTKVEDFQSDSEWIARKLNLPVWQVNAAIEVLLHLQLLRQKDGRLQLPTEMVRTESVPSRAIREHHRQFLKMAIDSLEAQDHHQRDITGTCIAIDPEKLPEAKRLNKEFRENLTECLSETGKCTQVYRLSVQLFRLDNDLQQPMKAKGRS